MKNNTSIKCSVSAGCLGSPKPIGLIQSLLSETNVSVKDLTEQIYQLKAQIAPVLNGERLEQEAKDTCRASHDSTVAQEIYEISRNVAELCREVELIRSRVAL